jgi:hypothetical protein
MATSATLGFELLAAVSGTLSAVVEIALPL